MKQQITAKQKFSAVFQKIHCNYFKIYYMLRQQEITGKQ